MNMNKIDILITGDEQFNTNIKFSLGKKFEEQFNIEYFKNVDNIYKSLNKVSFQFVIMELSIDKLSIDKEQNVKDKEIREKKIEILRDIKRKYTDTLIIVCSGDRDIITAFEVGRIGVYRLYLRKNT